jgi:hypothetical protein
VISDPDFGLPDFGLAAVDKEGKFSAAWQRGLTRLAQLTAARKIAAVSPGASPFTYTATTIGNLLITGGNVSAVLLTRGLQSAACPVSGFIPMAAKDSVTITYTVAPTLTFVPNARA